MLVEHAACSDIHQLDRIVLTVPITMRAVCQNTFGYTAFGYCLDLACSEVDAFSLCKINWRRRECTISISFLILK